MLRHGFMAQAWRLSPHGRALTCPSTVLLIGLLVLGIVGSRFVRLNVQPSVPYGFYRALPVPARLERGMLMMLWPPAVTHPWYPWWQSLTKPIAGLPGDQVCIWDEGMWIRGEPYGAVLTEAHGMALPRRRGCFLVQEGEVFLATKTVRTLDGRYYGPVPVSALTAQAEPLWIWQ